MNEPIPSIGGRSLAGRAFLAPMAGVSDYAVRTLAKRYGAALVCGEMVSAKGVSMESEKSRELLFLPDAHPYAVQLFGGDPASMKKAAAIAAEGHPDLIDVNLGCPAPKIVSGNAGSALLRDLPLLGEVVAAAVEGAGEIPVTVKIRRGFGPADDVAVEAARTAERAGAKAIAVHGRTRAQMYAPPVDLDCIRRVKDAVSVPVIGNGDICSGDDALAMRRLTGCDFVMIGRGALGRPWLFAEVNAVLAGKAPPAPPTLDERLAVMREEIAMLVADKGDYTGFREARKHAAWYLTGLRGAAALRRLCGGIESWAEIDALCRIAREENA